MLQIHKIILWKNPEPKNKNFSDTARETFQLLNIFNQFDCIYRPNYITGYSKKYSVEFDWNYDHFVNMLESQAIDNKNNNQLGYTLSFFSSKKEENSFHYQMIVGNKCHDLYNTFVIIIPPSIDLYQKNTAEIIIDMFQKLVFNFEPFWACISNKLISMNYKGYIDKGKPTTVHWLNYWSDDIIKNIGLNNIKHTIQENPQVYFKNGILKIKDCALNINDESDMQFYKKLELELGLNNYV